MPIKNKPDSVKILGTRIDSVQVADVIRAMEDYIINRSSGKYIMTSNANNVVLGVKDEKVREAANKSDLSVADGMSLVLAARLYGMHLKRRVYGPEFMWEFLKLAEQKGYVSYFYGSSLENLEKLKSALLKRFPVMKIAGMYSPAFREDIGEEMAVLDRINNSGADVLWVGLGGPKQELWMLHHRDKIKIPVMAGVGAAFDFLAETKLQAPRWIRESGFEWLFRLMIEPKRLWRRYLVNNSLFLYYVFIELISRNFRPSKNIPA